MKLACRSSSAWLAGEALEARRLREDAVDLHRATAAAVALDVARRRRRGSARRRRGRARSSSGGRRRRRPGRATARPMSSVTPLTRPPLTSIEATAASVRITAPDARALAAIDSEIAPMPPRTWPHSPTIAVELAEPVVQEVVGGARGARPRPDADDARRRHRALDHVGLEPLLEQLADRHRHHAVELLHLALAEAGEPRALAQQVEQVVGALREPGWGGGRSSIGWRKTARRSNISSKPG